MTCPPQRGRPSRIIGPIQDILPAGNHADITSTIAGEHTTVFVKATRKLLDRDGPEIQSLRWEEKATPFVSAHTPANPPAHRTWSLVAQTVERLQKTPAASVVTGLSPHMGVVR